MNEKIIRCPICGKITALESNNRIQKIEQVNGICWDRIVYSIGGWGSRCDFITPFSGEVCNDCFDVLKIKINELKNAFDKRKDSCDEGICIYKKSQGNNMSSMWEDELQPKRRKKPLLWLLSSFSLTEYHE